MAGPSPIAALPGRLEYGLKAAMRLTWYSSQAAAIRRAVGRLDPDQVRPRDRSPDNDETEAPSADRGFMLRDIAGLFARDLANVEAGLYPMPDDDPGGLPAMIRRSRMVMADLPAVAKRRRDGDHQLPEIGEDAAHLPRYYRQNFHFQSDGWLSEKSAELYDTQVEILFSGAAAAMRRQVLVPIADMLHGIDQRGCVAADIACGSGLLLRDIKRAWPRLPAFGLDLSEPYLRRAGHRLRNRARTGLTVANAETLPLADNSLDCATMAYLLHELPASARANVAREAARVLKPGGLLIVLDSLQTDDEPLYNRHLQSFPRLMHEPYYGGYLRTDLKALFGGAGLTLESTKRAFLSKVIVFQNR